MTSAPHQSPAIKILNLAFALIILSACTPQNQLLGQWNQIDGEQSWEFRQDGTFTLTEPGTTLTGTYEILGDNQLLITFHQYEDLIEPILFTYTLDGNTLTLTSDLYGKLEYLRATIK